METLFKSYLDTVVKRVALGFPFWLSTSLISSFDTETKNKICEPNLFEHIQILFQGSTGPIVVENFGGDLCPAVDVSRRGDDIPILKFTVPKQLISLLSLLRRIQC
jgi:hypothetical protein